MTFAHAIAAMCFLGLIIIGWAGWELWQDYRWRKDEDYWERQYGKVDTTQRMPPVDESTNY